MPVKLNNIIYEFAKEAKKIYGENLSKIILYGSYARGDYAEYSDIDVMILVNIPDNEIKKTTDEVSDIAFGFMMEYGVNISPVVKNVDHFNYWVETLPFYRNIRDEGVVLSA